MKTKECSNCGKRKPLDQFGRRRYGEKQTVLSSCRDCLNAYKRAWMSANPSARSRNKKIGAESRRKLAEEIDELKVATPCADCGYNYNPWQMQFDHVRGAKVGNVSDYTRRGSRHKAYEEIEKCEVVCANCHADRTHRRRVAQEQSAALT